MKFPRAFPEGWLGVARWKAAPEDFSVVEIPLLSPAPSGAYALVEVTKRDLSTPALLRAVADQAGLPRGEVGAAGFKDRCAMTRQWISLPAACAGARPNLPEVLDWQPRGFVDEPLRPGQLRGNRFRLRLQDCSLSVEQFQSLWARQLPLGWANYYGIQRFGQQPHYREAALGMLRAPGPKKQRRRWPHNFQLNSLVSELFNGFLQRRIEQGRFMVARPGDWCRSERRGDFRAVGGPDEQRALAAFELAPLGPIWGYKLDDPTPEEQGLLQELGLTSESFRPFRAPGSRRPLRLPLPQLDLQSSGHRQLEVAFELPPGAYATVLLAHFWQEGNFMGSEDVLATVEVLDVTDKSEATPSAGPTAQNSPSG